MTINLDANYRCDNEGGVTSMSYPDSYFPPGYAQQQPTAGTLVGYGYDTMGRPYTLTETGPGTPGVVVSQMTYGPSNETLSMTAFSIVDWWSYNAMLQVTQTSQGWLQMMYGYPAGKNNGKIGATWDGVLGESVSYTYDSLNRLASASASNGAWGNAYVYDGYGNLLQKNVTAGSAPSLSQAVNGGTNQIVGDSYDANGNQTSLYIAGAGNVQLTYDIANRMTGILYYGLGSYAYNPQNQRVWRKTVNGSGQATEVFSFYGIDGRVLETYTPGYVSYMGATYMTLTQAEEELYMAGRLIGRTNWEYTNSFQPISADPLGTVRWDAAAPPNGVTEAFWPWGEERGTVTGNDRTKWGTYWRDSESSLDYGVNRYYDNVTGRFMTVDPYGGSAVAGNPQSWNRYGYGLGDPVNGNDPTGLDSTICPASGETGQCYTVPDGSSYSGNTDVTVDENGVPIGITNITNTESVTVNGDSGVSDPNLYNASDPTGMQPGDPGQQGEHPGGGGTQSGGAPDKPNVFACASEAAEKVSLAGGLQALGVLRSGLGGFITNAIGGNAFSGATDLISSFVTGEGGGHSVFYNMGQVLWRVRRRASEPFLTSRLKVRHLPLARWTRS